MSEAADVTDYSFPAPWDAEALSAYDSAECVSVHRAGVTITRPTSRSAVNVPAELPPPAASLWPSVPRPSEQHRSGDRLGSPLFLSLLLPDCSVTAVVYVNKTSQNVKLCNTTGVLLLIWLIKTKGLHQIMTLCPVLEMHTVQLGH